MKKTHLFFLLSFLTLNLFAWEGEGTISNPFQIATPQDLIDLSKSNDSYEGIYFIQTQDIDMQECTDFKAIGTNYTNKFKGNYDGQNYKIKNLKVSKGSDGFGGVINNIGLFGAASGSVIKRIQITGDSRFEGYENIGSIVGNANNVEISDCRSSAVVIGGGNYVGGIVGSGTTVSNCNFTGSLTAEGSNIGGIAGLATKVESCYNYGTVKGVGSVGGICGYLPVDALITDCYNKGDVTGTGENTGGIVGCIPSGLVSSATINKCHNAGTIKGAAYVGGVAGRSAVTIEKSGNSGNVEATGANVGGIVGHGPVILSYNKGNVTGNENVGGIAGSMSDIVNCYNTGTISGSNKVGGIAGANNGTSTKLLNSYNRGNVIADEQNVGGVLGFVNTGGLINSNKIDNTYWNSDVYTGKGVGNLTGTSTNFIFYPKTSDELKNNFSQTLGVYWKEDDDNINEGFPVLGDEINSINNYSSALSNVKVYSFENKIRIVNESQTAIKQVIVFDMFGRKVYQNTPTNSIEEITLDVSVGVYVVRLFNGTESGSHKVMLRK